MPQLQWLDLKDNPLEAPFSGFAGDCLDDGACRQCAKNVRENMAVLGLELDKRNRIKQKQKLSELLLSVLCCCCMVSVVVASDPLEYI